VLVIFFRENSGPFSFGVEFMGSGGKPIENKPLDTQTMGAIQAVNEESPYQKILDAKIAKFNAWDTGTGEYAGKPKDVTNAPGMDNYLDIYGNADKAAAQSRVGDPTHAFTANLPGYNNQLEQQKQMSMYDTRAEGLNSALTGLRSEANSEGMADSGMDVARRGAYANAMQGYNNSYYQRPQQVPLWQQIAGLAFGGLSAAGAAGGSKGIAGLAAI
jgi:hypothetical protein